MYQCRHQGLISQKDGVTLVGVVWRVRYAFLIVGSDQEMHILNLLCVFYNYAKEQCRLEAPLGLWSQGWARPGLMHGAQYHGAHYGVLQQPLTWWVMNQGRCAARGDRQEQKEMGWGQGLRPALLWPRWGGADGPRDCNWGPGTCAGWGTGSGLVRDIRPGSVLRALADF